MGAGNVLNISILFGLHVTGVLPDVSPHPRHPPPLHSPLSVSKETAVYICHLGISFHLTLLALIFFVGIRIVAFPFASCFLSIFYDTRANVRMEYRYSTRYLHK